MVARLSIYENVDLELFDRLHSWFETVDADPFADLPGYRGSMTLIDRENARLVGIGFYATDGHAREADALVAAVHERSRAEIPEDVRPALEARADSVAVYEIAHRD
jgi:hypothetical protein